MSRRRLDHPFHIDGRGRVATTDEDDHIGDMIRQVLLTSPGERVNRPDFGSGLLQLVFMPSSDVLATATQFLVQGALQRWLGDLIQIERVFVEGGGETITVKVVYIKRDTGESGREVVSYSAEEG